MNKHGYYIEICAKWETEEEAFEHEKFLVWCFKDIGTKLTNITSGGEGTSGRKMPPEQLEKHIARVKKQASDPEWRKRISNTLKNGPHPMRGKPSWNRGKPMLPQVKEALLAKHLRNNPEAMRKMIETKRGQKLTEEHKRKIAEALKGKPKSKEMREKLAKSKTGFKYTDEAREKMRQSRLAYIQRQNEKNAADEQIQSTSDDSKCHK